MPSATRDLAFEDLADGGVAISDATHGQADLDGGTADGRLHPRHHARADPRSHRLEDKPLHSSFRLTRWSDGRLSIEDPATHRKLRTGSLRLDQREGLRAAPRSAGRKLGRREGTGAAMKAGRMQRGNGGRGTIDVPCTIDLEQSPDSLHAYVDLDRHRCRSRRRGLGPRCADQPIPFGQQAVYQRQATVRRAGPLQRAWAHVEGYLELTELFEVSFSDGRAS